jgi:glycosyltransferase involved in cell wall biosynthesis
MIIAIVLPVLANGDAVGIDAIGMAEALRSRGHEVILFAEKSLISEPVWPISALVQSRAELLIVHHSHGSAAIMSAAASFAGAVIVKYHNVTPPEYFPAGSEVRAAADLGLSQIHRYCGFARQIWTDSAFNAAGLTASCAVVPPFMQTETLLNSAVDAETASAVESAATTLLCVGRVAPNKNLPLAIDVLARLRKSDPTARLIIAGGHVFEDASRALTDRIAEHGLSRHVIITGRVTVPQLKALYLSADALLLTSAHEGFCVPMVEAMALGVPIVAVKSTAIPETAGDAALLGPANVESLVAAVRSVVTSPELQSRLIANGFLRHRREFSQAAIQSRFLLQFEETVRERCRAA